VCAQNSQGAAQVISSPEPYGTAALRLTFDDQACREQCNRFPENRLSALVPLFHESWYQHGGLVLDHGAEPGGRRSPTTFCWSTGHGRVVAKLIV